MVIAIDGPAGSGKSTIAKLLAKQLKGPDGKEFTYVNSGNLYRAITLGCLRTRIRVTDSEKVLEFAKQLNISYRKDRVFMENIDVTDSLHSDEIDQNSAPLSAIVPVRHLVNSLIHSMAENRNLVAEGRDMTTVVFPQAECRFYLDASADSRAKRRYEQGVSRLGLEEIRQAIQKRDEIDKNKAEGSLIIGTGVDYLDTSDLTINEVYDRLINIIYRKLKL